MKEDAVYRTDATGVLRIRKEPNAPLALLDSDYRLRLAFQRRALAFDQAGVIGYDVLERWTHTMLRAMLRVPPEGYQRVSIEQLIRADREVFRLAQERSRSGIRVGADGIPPLNQIIHDCSETAAVAVLLMPLPARVAAASSPQARVGPPSPPKKPKVAGPPPAKAAGRRPDIRRKGPMPAALKGGASAMRDGTTRVCWGFNLRTCKGELKKDKESRMACPKGVHVCCKCLKPGHVFAECSA